jgi:hypothetical protein
VPWYLFLAVALVVAVGLGFGLHRLLRHLGDSGLVDYTPVPPTKKSVGTAMMTFHTLFEPAVEHIIEYERSGGLTVQTSGEPETDPESKDAAAESDLS